VYKEVFGLVTALFIHSPFGCWVASSNDKSGPTIQNFTDSKINKKNFFRSKSAQK